ncbi:chaperone protein DNAJ-like protein [Lotmaria passim]
MRSACREARMGRWPLWQQRRRFQVIQRGHDKPQESLYDKLGFAKDSEGHRVRRSVQELRQGLLRQVEKLADPVNDPKDKKRLEELKTAYTLLHDNNFRANYGGHYYASNDAQLHVLCDGGQVAANFNPEHQQFTYVDHAIDRDSHTGRSCSSVSGGGVGGSLGGTSAQSGGNAEVPTAEALRVAFQNATGVGKTSSGTTSSSARAFKSAEAAGPLDGADIAHLLRLTLEQSLSGCEVAVELHKNVKCTTCRGTGRQRVSKPRKCPQCLGRGSTHIPSATYHIERRCLYCGGEGTVAAPPCRSCEGRGVILNTPVRVTVEVPPGTQSNALFRLRHHGHDGVRGGHAGDLLVTVLVSEHRYFVRRTEKHGEQLHAMLPLPLSVALLGGRVAVPTLTGRGELHVPPCVRNGQVLPYSTYGVRSSTEKEAACNANIQLFFHALVMIPRVNDLTGRQRHALDLYELTHASSAAAEMGTEEETLQVQQGSTSTFMPSPPPSRDKLMEECAALKNVYKDWFSK